MSNYSKVVGEAKTVSFQWMHECIQWHSQGGRGESPPCPILGDPFLIRTIKYCNLSLLTFNDNTQFTCFGESMPGLKEPILGLMGPTPGSRGSILGTRGPFESKAGENNQFSFLGRSSLDQGTLPWLISPPSPELWLGRWVYINIFSVIGLAEHPKKPSCNGTWMDLSKTYF